MPCLFQIDAFDPVAGAAVTLRFASVDDSAACHLNGQTWWPVLDRLPLLGLDFFGGEFGRVTTPGASISLSFEPYPNFARYSFADARIRMWHGATGAIWAGYTLRFDGRVSGAPSIEEGRAEIAFAVDDKWLDNPMLATFAGTGGAEGRIEMRGTPKPLAIGAPLGVPGQMVDPVRSIIQLSAYGAIESVDVPLERLARQFGVADANYANYAALEAATVAAGKWATSLSTGHVRMGAPPFGKLCFLMKGDKGGVDGWVRKPGSIIKRMADLVGGIAKVNEASVDGLDAARPYNLSRYDGNQITARQAIQEIAASVNAVAGVSLTGELIVVPIQINAATLTLRSDGTATPMVAEMREVGISAPFWRLAIGAQPFWDVHGQSDYVTEASDNPDLLTIEQKAVLIADEAAREDRYTKLRADMVAKGLSVTAMDTTHGNWTVHLAAQGPAWNDTSAHTALSAGRTTWNGILAAYEAELNAADKAVSQYNAAHAIIGGPYTVDLNGNPWDATNGATADLRLTSIGAYPLTIVGNTIKSGISTGYDNCVVGDILPPASFIEMDIHPTEWTLLSLDNDGTSVFYGDQNIQIQYNRSFSGLTIYRDGGLVYTGTIGALNGKVRLLNDRARFRVFVGGTEYLKEVSYDAVMAVPANAAFYAKWYAYAANTLYTGLRAGPATDNLTAAGDIRLVSIGSDVATIVGNTATKTAAAGFNAAVRGQRYIGPMFASAAIRQAGAHTIVGLDTSGTQYDRSQAEFYVQYYWGTGAVEIYKSSGSPVWTGNVGANLTGEVLINYDNGGYFASVSGIPVGDFYPASPALAHFPVFYIFDDSGSISGMRAGPATDNLTAAGQLTKLTVINSGWAKVSGNSVSNITASDSYNSTVNGERQQGPCYVECEINPSGYTMLGFDEVEGDSSAYNLEWQCHIYNGGVGLTLYKDNATSAPISSGAYSGSGGKMGRLVYDGSYVWLEINGEIVLDTKVPAPASKKYYPKITPYSAGAIIRRISYGPYNDSRFDSIGPIGKPEPYATSADNMIPNGSLSQKLEPFAVLTISGSAAYWLAGSTGDPSSGYVVFPPGGQNYLRANYAEAKPLLGAQKLYLSVDIYRPSGVTGGNIIGVIRYFKPNGAASSIKVYDDPILTPSGLGWTNVTAIGTPPSDASHWGFDLYGDPVGAALLATNIRLAKTEPAADVTSAITGPALVLIQCDNGGSPKYGQLPKPVNFQLYRNGVDVTTAATWTVDAVVSGSITSSFTSGGVLSITAIGTLKNRIRVKAVYQGSSRTFEADVNKDPDPAATGGGGGGGTSATQTVSYSSSANSMGTASADLEFTTGAAGTANLTGLINFEADGGYPTGTYGAYWIWQRWNGSSWVDVTTETYCTATTVIDRYYDDYLGDYVYNTIAIGEMNVAKTVTGLGATTAVKFRLRIRCATSGRTLFFYSSPNIGGSGS